MPSLKEARVSGWTYKYAHRLQQRAQSHDGVVKVMRKYLLAWEKFVGSWS